MMQFDWRYQESELMKTKFDETGVAFLWKSCFKFRWSYKRNVLTFCDGNSNSRMGLKIKKRICNYFKPWSAYTNKNFRQWIYWLLSKLWIKLIALVQPVAWLILFLCPWSRDENSTWGCAIVNNSRITLPHK